MPTKIVLHTHGAKGGVYFVQLEPDNWCGNNSRTGKFQGNMVIITHVTSISMHVKLYIGIVSKWAVENYISY